MSGEEKPVVKRQEAIIGHYERSWGTRPQKVDFSEGPIHQLPPDFAVLKFGPSADRDMWTYSTACMSQEGDKKALELHVHSPYETDDVAELLVATAHYHRTGAILDLGHSVNFGRPWLNHARADHGLILLPYLDGPSLEIFNLEGGPIHFYWLLPITREEITFKKIHGLEALETEFDKVGLKYLSPDRGSVV
ncbi:suppressor of fused domain protein [Neorhizobium sp. P12A]|nr:suppressor of fused domain protein [Neorhizobium sp. P12A]